MAMSLILFLLLESGVCTLPTESSALLIFAKASVGTQRLPPCVAVFGLLVWALFPVFHARPVGFWSPAQGRRSGLSRARRPRPGSLCLQGPSESVCPASSPFSSLRAEAWHVCECLVRFQSQALCPQLFYIQS